jgi:AmmeMemoRadiSam system protein A
MKFSIEDGKVLIDIARKAIENYLERGIKISPPKNLSKKFYEKLGVFVTLEKNHELRGCIGYPFPTRPLVEALIDSAIDSALNDDRFPPVQKNELKDICIEVSILGKLELLKVNKPEEYLKKIKVGGDGLVIEKGWFSGLFLPQVWQLIPNPEEFLDALCLKAGLPKRSWLDKNTKIYRFRVQAFREVEPYGDVEEVKFTS